MKRVVVAVLVATACATPATPPRATGSAKPISTSVTAPRCDGAFDARAFLDRHARAYGTEAAVAAALPIVLDGTAEIEGKSGPTEIVLARDRHRVSASVAGLSFAGGVDAKGAWSLGGGSGVVERLTDDESIDVRIDGWLLRRGYLGFDPSRDKATCRDGDGAPRVEVLLARRDLGDPELVFDLATSALLSFSHRQSDGKKIRVTIESWTEADKGVRWPRKTTEHPITGSPSTSTFARVVPGLSCRSVTAADAPSIDGEACLAPPPDRFTIEWPASGRVSVPMKLYDDELLVRASIGAREVWALLDSGAGITTVDATTPSGETFKPAIEVEGGGSTQKIKLGIGALPVVSLGALRAKDVPTASVPIPALEAFGAKRPELILGYSFFAAAAIRVDYKKGEIVLARSADGLAAPSARRIAVRNVSGMLLADGEIEGHKALFQVDTGSSGALDVVKKWASPRGIPGDTKTVSVRGRFGAGTGETTATYFRLGRASLGPIKADGLLSQISDPPEHGDVAGLAGNAVLGRCDAVVFDHAGRSLLVEGTCERPAREHKMGWKLSKKPDAASPDRPWVIATVWPGGAAEKAGLAAGDRILEVGGKPATLDLEPIGRIEEQPAGTKVPVVFARGEGKDAVRKTTTAELAPLLPPR